MERDGWVGLSGETPPLPNVMNRFPSPGNATASHFRIIIVISFSFSQDFDLCSGFPFCLVEAIFSSSFSLMDLAISLDAPRSSLFDLSPRFAAKAAPAACCYALDFAGIFISCEGLIGFDRCFRVSFHADRDSQDHSGARHWGSSKSNSSWGSSGWG